MLRNLLALSLSSALLACPEPPIDRSRGELSLSPPSLNFGVVAVGGSVSGTVTLKNTGDAAVNVTSVSFDSAAPAFTLATVSAPFTLASQQEVTFTVTYRPASERADGALLTIASDASNAPTLNLSIAGRGVSASFDAGFDAGSDGGPGNDPDGGPTRPADGGCAYVNQWLAFDSNRGGNRDLYAMLPGCPARQLTNQASTELEPAFSPDGTRLAFVSDRVGFTFQLFVMELADGGITQITTTGGASLGDGGVPVGADQPAWSPDGLELAFHRGAGVYRTPLDGGPEVPVISGPGGGYKNPVYSADGLRLIVDRANELSSVLLNGTDKRFIVGNTTTTIVEPALSPDGFSVAVAIWCTVGAGTSIWVVPYAGTAEACRTGGTEVVGPVAGNPAWGSPYLAWEASGELWMRVPVGFGQGTNITNSPGDDRNPAWAPLGTTLP